MYQSDKEKHKKYIKFLKSEIEKRDNKDELNKKMILSEDASLFIHSYRTNEEHEKLVNEIGQEGTWFYPISSTDEIKRILFPKNCKDILLNKRAVYIAEHSRTRRVFLKRKSIFETSNKEWSLTNYYDKDKHFSKTYMQTSRIRFCFYD